MLSVSAIGTTGLQLTCKDLLLWCNIECRAYAPPRMRVTAQTIAPTLVTPGPHGGGDHAATVAHDQSGDDTKAVLATALAHLARGLGAEAVNWLSRDVLIPADRFAEAALPVLPRRVQSREPGERPVPARLQPGEVTLPELGSFPIAPRRVASQAPRSERPRSRGAGRELGLNFSLKLRALRQKEEEIAEAIHSDVSLPLRVSAMIMTVLVGIFSVPLAWVLFAFNLNKGGDFRVTANVLAATAGLSLLHAAGVTQVLFNMLFQ
ncbi:MAG: hypothetical protein R3D85_15105 [Paracoccaceae bacterium]